MSRELPAPVARRRRALLPGLVLALLTACTGSTPADTAVVRDSAGIQITDNPMMDRSLGLEAVLVASLDPPDGAGTPVPWGVAVEPAEGRIHLVDWTGHRVLIFESHGSFRGVLGRTGEGPGEFRNPVAIAPRERRGVVVLDAGRGILSHWNPDATLRSEDRATFPYWGPGLAAGESGIFTVIAPPGDSPTRLEQALVLISEGGTTVLHQVPQEMTRAELPCGTLPAPRLLSPSVVWTGTDAGAWVARGTTYRLDFLGDGALQRSVRRAVPPLRVTRAMAEAAASTGPFAGFLRQCGITASDLVRAIGHVEEASPVLALVTDPSGYLWVTRTLDGATPHAVDRIDPAGRYLGSMPAPGIPAAFLADTLMVAVTIDGTGQPSAGIFALRAGG